MSEKTEKPLYMAKLLEQLGWNQGTRIPLANPINQASENILIEKHNEIQRLKEALILQNQKQSDLDKYKANIHTEYVENTRLLFAHKNQLEQEVKLRQLACNEADGLERDIVDCNKKIQEITSREDKLAGSVAKLLKQADDLKAEVCGEKGALQEWRAVIERSSGDIAAIEQFTKQDLSKAKALEYQRQKLKVEHDHVHDRLTQIVSNLAAEERACEIISIQVREGIDQRNYMMKMWAGAVENLRQRDTAIRHIREDYAVLEAEASRIAEQCREQQAFYEQQTGNNEETFRENQTLTLRLGKTRIAAQQMVDSNLTLESEVRCLERELANMQNKLDKLRSENKRIMDEQRRKDAMISQINQKIRELKLKVAESLDKTKSAERRVRQLEEMLNDEERYATGLTKNQQRAMHCSFVEQQKLLELQNEVKLFNMQVGASKAIFGKLATKEADIGRKLQCQKEAHYNIAYQVETLGARVLFMEGYQAEREFSAELLEKEKRLKDVLGRHTARVTLLERHSARLHDDMRRLTRELELKGYEHIKQQSHLRNSMLNVEGGHKELKTIREMFRRERVDEALLRLRVAHAARAVAGIEDTAFTLEKQRLQLDAAMNERLVEINVRKDMFSVQKRALLEDIGRLRSQIREREQSIQQLIKRYDIFIASLGKDDSGQQLSVSFFKIKFAAERAELREKGAALDQEIGRRERDVSALEATMRVVAAAHTHFLHHISPLAEETPEIQELQKLTEQYYTTRDQVKEIRAVESDLEMRVNDLNSKYTALADKNKQLAAREAEADIELENARDRYRKQEIQLQNAHDMAKYNAKRAKKLIEGIDDWRIFQLALWVRDYSEALHTALHSLNELCIAPADTRSRFAALLTATDIQRLMGRSERRLVLFIDRANEKRLEAETWLNLNHEEKVSASLKITDCECQKFLMSKRCVTSIINESTPNLKGLMNIEADESVFSTSEESDRSGVSQASGFTRRFASFRKTLASKVQEPVLMEEIAEKVLRSTVSLRVVTLGLQESLPLLSVSKTMKSRRAFK